MEYHVKEKIKRKLRFVGVLFCLVALTAVLVGCGNNAGDPTEGTDGNNQAITGHSDLTAQQMLDAILADVNDLKGALMDLPEEQVTDFFGFTEDFKPETAVKVSAMNVKSNEIGVFKVADGEEAGSLEAMVDKRINDAIANWMPGYMPEEITKMENYTFLTIGNFAIYVVADDADKEAILNNFKAEMTKGNTTK